MKKYKGIIAWGVAAAALIALRLYQLIALTDYGTGFIKIGSRTVYTVTSVIAVAIIATASVFITAGIKGPKEHKGFYLVTSLSALAFGAAAAADVLVNKYVNAPQYVKGACIFFGILTALFYALFAFRSAIHFPLSPKLAIIPVLFFVVKSVTVFVQGSYHVVISDTVVEVGFYSFIMLFLLEYARAVNGLAGKASVKKIAAFGVCASLFSALSAAKLIIAIFYPTALHDTAEGNVLPFFCGLYVVSVLFTQMKFVSQDDRVMGVYYSGKH
ncbi:MAG: hypothetical protein IKZ59_00715 [Clostridia bacterium]|nr:hypothetical protein [Clostridia bacterium]